MPPPILFLILLSRHIIQFLINVVSPTNFAILSPDENRKKEKEDAFKERQELLKQIEEYKRLEAEQLNRLRSKNKSYQEDLVHQIRFQQKKKDFEIDEARREIQTLQVSLVSIEIFSIEIRFYAELLSHEVVN